MTHHSEVLAELVRQHRDELLADASRSRRAGTADSQRWWHRLRNTRPVARHRAGTLVPCAPAVAE